MLYDVKIDGDSESNSDFRSLTDNDTKNGKNSNSKNLHKKSKFEIDEKLPNPMPMPKPKLPESTILLFAMESKRIKCITDIQENPTFRHLIDRLYLDQAYPDKSDRKTKQLKVKKLVNSVVNGFQVRFKQIFYLSN